MFNSAININKLQAHNPQQMQVQNTECATKQQEESTLFNNNELDQLTKFNELKHEFYKCIELNENQKIKNANGAHKLLNEIKVQYSEKYFEVACEFFNACIGLTANQTLRCSFKAYEILKSIKDTHKEDHFKMLCSMFNESAKPGANQNIRDTWAAYEILKDIYSGPNCQTIL